MPNENITIDQITPPDTDGDDLLNFFFLPDTYALYAPGSTTPAVTGIKAGSSFQYTPPGDDMPTFTIVVNSIDESGASGTWSDTGLLKDVPGSGTFQAQAGGTVPVEEEAVAAKAK